MPKGAVRGLSTLLWALSICLGTAAVGSAGAGEDVAPGLRVGDVLDQSNWQLAKDLLPAEILRHYETGE